MSEVRLEKDYPDLNTLFSIQNLIPDYKIKNTKHQKEKKFQKKLKHTYEIYY